MRLGGDASPHLVPRPTWLGCRQDGGVPSYGGIKAILISRLTARDVLHQRYYQLKFADTYYGEMTHYGLYRLAWVDVRRTR